MDESIQPTDDPKALIREAFAMGPEFPGPAEDLLLSWILSLDSATEPRAAARRLIGQYAPDSSRFENPHVRRLADLLQQTAVSDPGARGGRGRVAARRAASRSAG